jgi:PTH1 family peptidyl-tRNA hydrolase
MSIKLIVGLRNPGSEYQHTRHNAGAWFVESLLENQQTIFKSDKKMQAQWADINIQQFPCKIALPLTFMNHSGIPVRAICQFYRIELDELLVVHDDLDLAAGRIQLKTGGGHGGHNGLRDIIAQTGGAHFHRLRVGIGHPGQKELVLNYVLGKPSQQEKQQILAAIDRAVAIMPTLLMGNLAQAMTILNEVRDGI